MKRLMLVCANGLSTSILVSKMQQYCEKKGIDLEIFAKSETLAQEEIGKVDGVLLGPQLRFQEEKFSKLGEPSNTPVGAISFMDYGRLNAEAVVKQALKLMEG